MDEEPAIPDLQPGEEREVDGVLYVRPNPFVEHGHDFQEVSPGVYRCSQCPQGRIGSM